ncbi:MAG: hypothetical protein JW840_00290 [Candidatus Thermoplasmatota archaeon]|nr:hypothetical protein [Candidatus Thermoplasmatota archaeon]
MAIDWSFLFALSILVVVFPLLIIISLWRYRRIKQLMEQEALKRNGTVIGSRLLPVLKFSYRSVPVVVTSVPGSRYRQAKTVVNCTLRNPAAANLTIVKESLRTRLGKAVGATDVQLGSDEFDQEFVVKTLNESFARNVVTYMVQQKLLEMKQVKPRVDLQGTQLSVQVPRVVKTPEEYDRLFELSFAFVDRVEGV